VSFACAVPPVDPGLERAGVAVHCLGTSNVWAERSPLRAARRAIWDGTARRWLTALLRGFDPAGTLVHFHQWTKAFSPSVLMVPEHTGHAWAVTAHDYFLVCPNGAYFVFPRLEPCRVRPLSAACMLRACDSRSSAHKTVRVARQFGMRRALARRRRPLEVIHVSASAARVARPLLPADTHHHVIANPCAMELGDRVSAEFNEAVVYIGRLTPEKGCIVLAHAAAEAGVPLLMLGEGPAQAAIRAANPAVTLLPWGGREEVDACLRRARALVLPSLWYETGGLVAQEAAARGVPVIVSDRCGAGDWVRHAQTGLVVKGGDLASLAQALSTLRDDALVQRMSFNIHAEFLSGPHRVEVHAAALLECYAGILARHAGAR
jgi:glycosyltransferase involved in cell wall biosynthesis